MPKKAAKKAAPKKAAKKSAPKKMAEKVAHKAAFKSTRQAHVDAVASVMKALS